MHRFVIAILFFAAALAASAPAMATQGKGQSKGRGNPSAEKGNADAERERAAKEGRAFGKDHERTIREWFSVSSNLKGLPPGLAKKEQLPPGLQKQLERNGQLPPGLQKRVEPLPQTLEIKLPRLPDGRRRIVIAGNVILLEERTGLILDILRDIF